MYDSDRYRLLVLGAHKVGKTCLLRKYLYNEPVVTSVYKETVEDMHSRDFNIAGKTLPLDVIDTSSSYPDMRKLAVQQANAFMLVFAVDDVMSFRYMSEVWDEICQQRGDDLDFMPTIFVGNKTDLEAHKITITTVNKWLESRPHTVRARYIPTSALNGDGLVSAFRKLLELSEFNGITETRGTEPEDKLEKLNSSVPPNSLSTVQLESKLNRNRSFRVGKNRRAGKDGGEGGGESVPPDSGLKRTGSLLRRGVSLRRKSKTRVVDESDCRIS